MEIFSIEGWYVLLRWFHVLAGITWIGVLSSNAIGASGMIRYAEAAMQVRGQAGEHQIEGAKVALGHAYGGGSQYFSMCLFASEKL